MPKSSPNLQNDQNPQTPQNSQKLPKNSPKISSISSITSKSLKIPQKSPQIPPKKDQNTVPQPSIVSQICKNVNTNSGNWVYSDLVKEHFLAPRNFLMGDETKYLHDAEGVVGNPVCGDQMKMFLRIENDKIIDVKWKTYGCASAIASTSALSELAKGRTLDDALKITAADIAAYLGGLPAHKFHCSVLGHEALAAAIANYRAK